jgi:hypothetical protein
MYMNSDPPRLLTAVLTRLLKFGSAEDKLFMDCNQICVEDNPYKPPEIPWPVVAWFASSL